jgi:hypothetical protein
MANKSGKLELIIGPMFSGKSTELIRKIRVIKSINKKILVIKPKIDNRYKLNRIVSHNQESEDCIITDDLELTDIKGYIAILNNHLEKLEAKIINPEDQLRQSLTNIPEDRRAEVKEAGEEAFKQAKEQIKALEKEINKAKLKLSSKSKSININTQLLDNSKALGEELEWETWIPMGVRRVVDEGNDAEVASDYRDPGVSRIGDDAEKLIELLGQEEGTENSGSGLSHLETTKGTRYPDSKKEIKSDEATLKRQLESLESRKKAFEKLYKEEGVPYDPKSGLDVTVIPDESDKRDYASLITKIARITDKMKTTKTGSGFPKAELLAHPKQQYNSMGRPLSNDDSINNDMIKANNNWEINNNPPHDAPLGNLNPFLPKSIDSKYSYEAKLRKQNSIIHPETNALGANISLLQGPSVGMEGSGRRKPKSKAVKELLGSAIDAKNDIFEPNEMGENGFVPEDKDDQFKFPDLKKKERKRK